MALEKLRYHVIIGDQDHPCVQIIWADQLLAEREAHRHGITDKMGLAMTTYWCWAALKRQGLYSGDYQEFQTDNTLDIVPLEAEKVDPTPETVPGDSSSP